MRSKLVGNSQWNKRNDLYEDMKYMKKLMMISIILVSIAFSACGRSNTVEMVAGGVAVQNNDAMFIRHRLGDGYSILEERSTGVCYLEYHYSAGGDSIYGITCMINPDGTAKVWER